MLEVRNLLHNGMRCAPIPGAKRMVRPRRRAEMVAVEHNICRVRGRLHAILPTEEHMEGCHRPHARFVEGVKGDTGSAYGEEGEVGTGALADGAVAG